MPAILEANTVLIPSGAVSASGDFPALPLHPRTLPTCHWVLAVTVPPVASATFTLAVSTTQNGMFRTIATLVWPAGLSGSRQVPVGVQGHLAQVLNNQALWIRASVILSGPLTLAGSWLTKPSDGSFGLASRSYALDAINQL